MNLEEQIIFQQAQWKGQGTFPKSSQRYEVARHFWEWHVFWYSLR
jgi:hypothetical protein